MDAFTIKATYVQGYNLLSRTRNLVDNVVNLIKTMANGYTECIHYDYTTEL